MKTLFLVVLIVALVFVAVAAWVDHRAKTCERDIEEIRMRLRFFDPSHRPGSADSADIAKFVLRCCRYWGFKLKEFGIEDEDDLIRRALDASERAERYYNIPGFREDARRELASYSLKHV